MADDLAASRRFATSAAVVQTAFGLSLFLDPYGWSKVFRWGSEPQTDVGLYFGRCLGALAIGYGVEGFRAGRDPEQGRGWFRATETGGWLLAAVHVRGLLEGRQPWTEHAEIPGWAALAVGARRFAPGRD
ncbi:MAG TPA: hypothetical protein VF587_17640 [Solirubrobacteraceae bacterium]